MNSSYYRKQWHKLIHRTVHPDELKGLSRQIACSFLDHYLKDGGYEKEYIDLLCEMTTFSSDPALNSPGAHALFSIIIESLCDDFEELQTETYNRVMAQVISYCRGIPAGKELDMRLKAFEINTYDDLVKRTIAIRDIRNSLPDERQISKILLLSRVTIGADIAITSVIIQRLKSLFPNSHLVLIGSNKLEEVYGGNPGLTIREVPYSRAGGLLERLNSWHMVLNIIAEETDSGLMEKTVLFDPDSRLSQLGVLPLISPDRYFFFDSRSNSSLISRMSMPELTNKWIDDLSGEQGFCYPRVWIPEHHQIKAAYYRKSMRTSGARRIIAVNFGVGGNPRKRVGSQLEENLLLRLLNDPGTIIVLDKGAGDEEQSCINALTVAAEEKGHRAEHIHFGAESELKISHGIIAVQCSIGEMASLIAHCDEYIGYDSACQHIAAALGTPCVTIFAGSNNMRFIRRWSAHGPAECNIVHVDTLNDPSLIDIDNIISRVMHAREIQSSVR